MKLPEHPFEAIDWSQITPTEHKGETGYALWYTKYYNEIRVRKVEYSQNYKADHWCSKGHIITVIKGIIKTELKDGRSYIISEGMSYIAGDDDVPHRSCTAEPAILLIID